MLNHSFSPTPPHQLIDNDNVFAVIPFSSKCEATEPGIIYSGVESVCSRSLSEVWTVTEKVTRGITGKGHWSKTANLICVAYWLSEQECQEIEQSTFEAYQALFSILNEHGFPHPFRFWNYLPEINVGEGDRELYKRFCTGRLKAFEAAEIPPEGFPSASALGHHSKGAVFYVMASAEIPQNFKNGRQINAYEYPRQYGISSPSFARASGLTIQNAPYLFISGTASIIGHQTVEVGNLERQLEVTAGNIEHLLVHANPDNRALSTFKVYIRFEEDLEKTQVWLKKNYPNVETVITIADICRSDLLVEIECFCR